MLGESFWLRGITVIRLALFAQRQDLVPINPGQPLTVCEVLQDLSSYRGKNIEIRGVWAGAYLIDDCAQLKTGGHIWPNAILTVEPDDVRTQDPVSWRMDANAYRRAVRTMNRSTVRATFVGRLDARARLFVVTEGVPEPVPGGFGHLGQFPARLVIGTIKDVMTSKGKIFTGDPS